MSFNGYKSTIEENDTVILYLNFNTMYAFQVTPTKANRYQCYETFILRNLRQRRRTYKCLTPILSSITPEKKFVNTGHRKGEEVENVFQTIYGAFKVKDLIGLKFGSKVVLSKGYCYALYPTPELWTKAQCHKTFFCS
jgi:hypothetical protein